VRSSLKPLVRVAGFLGSIHLFFGFVFFVPIVSVFLFTTETEKTSSVISFAVPALLTLILGEVLVRAFGTEAPRNAKEASLLCVAGWLSISAIGAIPFVIQLDTSFLDAYFETVSGFTTTGITMLSGLDGMNPSILLWRSFIQWLGGLGILAFFLVFMFSGSGAHRIFSAESHKILAKRPLPGLFSTLRILWIIYCLLTALCVLLLLLGGMSPFDSLCHAFTALSTGGFSPHDASIAYYRQAGYTHSVFIEYVLVFFMLCGGVSFLIHFRLLRRDWRALFDSAEVKLLWLILVVSTLIVMLEHMKSHSDSLEESFRTSLFQVTSILTTTGFATEDIGSPFFGAAAKQIFLLLMVIGGCVGSTGGGIKVLRVAILLKMLKRQVTKIVYPHRASVVLTLDGSVIDNEELRRVSALFFGWMLLLAVGGIITALLSEYGPLQSASGMFSALGNIGPCYITDFPSLHPVIKVTYIFGMLAGRLEIIPLILLFSKKSWT